MRLRGNPGTNERGASALRPCRGSILVALPSLQDSNFRKTIIFLSQHDAEDGAIGFILNRPRKESLGELVAAPDGLEQVPVFEGGPVEPQSLILTRLLWNQEKAHFESLGQEDLVEKGNAAGLRAFTGYAGWSAGQLEGEVKEKSWVILAPTPSLLEPALTFEEGILHWKSLMKELGPWYHLLSEAPDDPKLN